MTGRVKNLQRREYTSRSPAETVELGFSLGAGLRAGDVVSLEGPLGAGKTCLVQGLAAGLGLAAEQVQSPTFTLINEYAGSPPLYHFDLYRLSKLEDLAQIGFYDYLDPESGIVPGVVVVEWADKLPVKFPEAAIYVTLAYADAQTRRIVIKGRNRQA